MAETKLGCIVMAAGASVRFGSENKLLADFGGKPVLTRTLSMLPRDEFSRIVCVVSCEETQALCEENAFPFVRTEGGAVSVSIRAGVRCMEGMDGCMFVNGDMPLLREESIRAMAARFHLAPEKGLRLSVNGEAVSPVLFPKSFFPDLLALSGEKGGISILKKRGIVFDTVEASDPAEVLDIDTQEQLRDLQTRNTQQR